MRSKLEFDAALLLTAIPLSAAEAVALSGIIAAAVTPATTASPPSPVPISVGAADPQAAP